MRDGLQIAILTSFLILTIVCRTQPETTAGEDLEIELEAIKSLMAEYVSGYESKDVDNFVKVFTKDAIRMPPNGLAVVGSQGIRSYYEEWFQEETLDVAVIPKEIEVAGDWAYAWGTYEASVTPSDGQGSRTDRGKFLNIYRKGADGSWRFHRNIWNSDLPIPTDQNSEN
jgi:uncharacterized protein (TIGR02246 family)